MFDNYAKRREIEIALLYVMGMCYSASSFSFIPLCTQVHRALFSNFQNSLILKTMHLAGKVHIEVMRMMSLGTSTRMSAQIFQRTLSMQLVSLVQVQRCVARPRLHRGVSTDDVIEYS